MIDTNYWEKYYNSHLEFEESSLFAKFILEEYKPSGTMIELGCGNGRDAVYFAKNNIKHITGVDQCPNVISELNGLKIPNASFIQTDFTALSSNNSYDHIYSRFTLHSVGRIEASKTLNWAFQVLNKGGQLYIEVRSIKDGFFGIGKDLGDDAWVSDHYRRFVRVDELANELESIGFDLQYKVEDIGFAPYEDRNPSIIRIVAKKG